jgi:2-polyprenyl-3-methyl-5-hydroxy-6-metoxy-1,4-benzoquinol methylase
MTGDELKRFEAAGWNARADTYGDLTGRVTALVADPLLDAAGVVAGQRVLDVACGGGQVAERAAARGAVPVGVDLAEAMVERARRDHPQITFEVADVEQLPMADDTFDAAVGGFVLNHLPHPERAVAQCARVVALGGGVAFSVWDRPERARLIALVGDAVERAGGDRYAGVPDGPDDFRFADPDEMRALLEGAGLERIEVSTHELSVDVPDAETLWAGLMGGLARAPATVEAHDPRTRARVREAFEEICQEFREPEGTLEIPAVVVLGSGRVQG